MGPNYLKLAKDSSRDIKKKKIENLSLDSALTFDLAGGCVFSRRGRGGATVGRAPADSDRLRSQSLGGRTGWEPELVRLRTDSSLDEV